MQIIMRFRARSLASAFSAWRHESDQAMRKALNLREALLHWTNSSAARAFSGWAAAARELSWKRSALLKAALMWHHCHLGRAFHGWHSHALEAVMHRELVQPSVHRSLFLALDCFCLPSAVGLEAQGEVCIGTIALQHFGGGIKHAPSVSCSENGLPS